MHADEHQSFCKLGLLFLMEVARYVQSTQNKEFRIILQRLLQLLLCSIVMQNIQIFYDVQPCLLLLLFLHSQTVEIFCLNTAIQYLDSIYVGRDYHLCCPGSKLPFFKRTRVYCCKSSYAHQTSQKKLVSGLVIQKVYKTNVATQNSVTKCYHESHLRLDKDLEMWTGSLLSLICKSNIIVALYKIKGTILRRKKAMNGNNFLLRVM